MSAFHIEHIDDETGNSGVIVYEVPDDFEPTATYLAFAAGFAAAHLTKSGRLTERQRLTQSRQWIRHLDRQFQRVPHTHR